MGKFNKKTIITIVAIGLCFVLGIIGFVSYKILESDRNNKENTRELSLAKKLKDTNKIEVYHNYHEDNVDNIKPITITDKSIIKNYLDLMSKESNHGKRDLSGTSVENQKLIFFTEKDKIEIKYTYDDLYEFGFITYNGEEIDIDYDFFRLISSTERYEAKESNIPNDVEKLFEKYNFTPSFLINKYKEKLPSDLLYSPEKGIKELYWAYNLELSKGIGLDFSNLLSKEVEAECYYLLEEMPEFANPVNDTTAVVIRHNGEIVGAYIDSGIVNRAVASLDRRSFEEVSGVSIEDFLIKNHIDKDSKLNIEASKLSTEELIKTYYKSKEEKDISKYLSTLDVGNILSLLQPENMDLKYELFNNIDKEDSIFIHNSKTKVLEVESDSSNDKDEKEIKVKLDILDNNDPTLEKGVYQMIAILKKNENNTYKINSIGF